MSTTDTFKQCGTAENDQILVENFLDEYGVTSEDFLTDDFDFLVAPFAQYIRSGILNAQRPFDDAALAAKFDAFIDTLEFDELALFLLENYTGES